jgi:hypothetical protein
MPTANFSPPSETSERSGIIVAAVRTDDQIAITFHDTVPGTAFGVLHLLYYRAVRRGLLDGDRISRNGTGVLTRQRSHASGQARGE